MTPPANESEKTVPTETDRELSNSIVLQRFRHYQPSPELLKRSGNDRVLTKYGERIQALSKDHLCRCGCSREHHGHVMGIIHLGKCSSMKHSCPQFVPVEDARPTQLESAIAAHVAQARAADRQRIAELEAQVVALREASIEVLDVLDMLLSFGGPVEFARPGSPKEMMVSALAKTAADFEGKCVVDAKRLQELKNVLSAVKDCTAWHARCGILYERVDEIFSRK